MRAPSCPVICVRKQGCARHEKKSSDASLLSTRSSDSAWQTPVICCNTISRKYWRPRLNNFCVDACIGWRSEEHTYELQSLMRISYAVFCLKKTKNTREYQQ